MRNYKYREIGEIFILNCNNQPRNFIKTENGIVTYSVYLAKNNPHICGKWFKGCEVHHKDFNRLNDIPENLICLTPEEHNKIHQVFHCGTKSVIGWHQNNVIGIWNSLTNASKKTKCTVPSISHYCKYKYPISKTYTDYKWMYLDDYLADWWEQEMEKAV